MCIGSPKGQKRSSGFMELELKVIVSHLIWVLECELRASGEEEKVSFTSEPSL